MKIRRIFSVLVIMIFVFLWSGSVCAFAMNTEFSINEMESEDQKNFLSNIDLHFVDVEPQKHAITCFDVNDKGLLAVGVNTLTKKYISVYGSDGTFQYGYTFNCNGSFGVEWDDTNLIIYFVRSDVAALFDSNGTNIELGRIENTIDNNSYWNHFVFSAQRYIGEDQYIMRNDMGILNAFAFSYSQVAKIDSIGNVAILYDASSAYMKQIVMLIIASILFIVIVISVVIRRFIKIKR